MFNRYVKMQIAIAVFELAAKKEINIIAAKIFFLW